MQKKSLIQSFTSTSGYFNLVSTKTHTQWVHKQLSPPPLLFTIGLVVSVVHDVWVRVENRPNAVPTELSSGKVVVVVEEEERG